MDIDYGRVKVVVDGYKSLVFETEVDFHVGEHYDGDELQISLRYEKLLDAAGPVSAYVMTSISAHRSSGEEIRGPSAF